MSAASLLPVELWLTILNYALDVHPFFSLDPAADYIENPAAVSDWLRVRGWGDEVFQQRLVLRQVCRTWFEFVDRPEIKHRFVRLCDINGASASGHLVTLAGLVQAHRIEGVLYLGGVDHELDVLKQLRETAASGDTFDAEILTNADTNLTRFITKTNPSAFPHLKALGSRAHASLAGELFAAVSVHFPAMRFLSIKSSTRFDLSHGAGLQLPSLSTLIIESHISRDLSFDEWSLPSLCHLQIGVVASIAKLQTLITALTVLGPQLRVLGITLRTSNNSEHAYEGYDAHIMSQFWNHFPKLESLCFPLYFIISHTPPLEHLIRYLTSSDIKPAYYRWRAPTNDITATFIDALTAFCLAVPGLVAVRDSHEWTWAGPHDQDFDIVAPEQPDAGQHMAEVESRLQASNVKVRLEDINGRTLGEM